MRINRLQINVATGRFTLPVVILVCLLLWILSLGSYRELFTLLVFALTGYMIIETNIAFTLIRTRRGRCLSPCGSHRNRPGRHGTPGGGGRQDRRGEARGPQGEEEARRPQAPEEECGGISE